MKRKVRLFPTPQGAPAPLVEFIGNVVAGAVKSALGAHCKGMPRNVRGMLVGSIRKRVVNQITCSAGVESLTDIIQAHDLREFDRILSEVIGEDKGETRELNMAEVDALLGFDNADPTYIDQGPRQAPSTPSTEGER